jgi:hypothetical protein
VGACVATTPTVNPSTTAGLAATTGGLTVVCSSFTSFTAAVVNSSLTAYNYNAAGSSDILVAAFNATSGAALWAVAFGGSGSDLGLAATADSAGNVYIGGVFASPALMLGAYRWTSTGTKNTFMAQLSAATGVVVWAVASSGTGNDDLASLAHDASGSLFSCGFFASPAPNFGSSTLALAPATSQVMFVAAVAWPTACAGCAAGAYSTLPTGSPPCTLCVAGTYSALTTGTAGCTACGTGSYTNAAVGATACTSCVAGALQRGGHGHLGVQPLVPQARTRQRPPRRPALRAPRAPSAPFWPQRTAASAPQTGVMRQCLMA